MRQKHATGLATDPSLPTPQRSQKQHSQKPDRPALFFALTLLPILGASLVAVLASSRLAGAHTSVPLAPTALATTLDSFAAGAEKPADEAVATASENGDAPNAGAQETRAAEAAAEGNNPKGASSAAAGLAGNPSPVAGNPNATCGQPIQQDIRPALAHGPKEASYQRYIVLHDTEGTGDAASVVDYWDSTGTYVAAHFVVGRDGAIVQCVPLDAIAHHAGFGDAGHNEAFGLVEDGRDDLRGTQSIGSEYPDYAMNAYSVGIELVHCTNDADYPQAQLNALDELIGYIDDYYGFESPILCHRDWRSTNSDTSELFAPYLASYQAQRRHG